MSETSRRNAPEEPGKLDITDFTTGLSSQESDSKTLQFGLNELDQVKPESILSILQRQFNSVIVWILAAAATVSFFLGDTLEGIAVIAVILINAITGFVLEYNARQSM